MDEELQDPEGLAFHSALREYVIFLLLFAVLFVCSCVLLRRYLQRESDFVVGGRTACNGCRGSRERDEDRGEAAVQRVCLAVCTFALTVSVSAALLLPISILSNEVLLHYPSSYYVKWLNSSLISGLWNHVFLFSNVSIFILLPFAYFFSEAEGLGGQQGLMGRVYEAFIVQILLAVTILGMALVAYASLDKSQSAVALLLDFWNYLPFLYSCVSFLGVVLLLLCTPLGFARLFSLLGQVIVKPSFMTDVNDEYYAVLFEESCMRHRLHTSSRKALEESEPVLDLEHLEKLRQQLNQQRRSSPILRGLLYPSAMILLLVLTLFALVSVLHNTAQLVVGIKAVGSGGRDFSLGLSSLSKLGIVGALMQVVLIGYLLAASTVGLYTLPVLSQLRPTVRSTPLTRLIVNCALVLVLSSALPLLSTILGISNFDLLGNYARIEWLGNFYLVLLYNVVFASTAMFCLAKKVTNSLLVELWRRMKSALEAFLVHHGSRRNQQQHHRMLSPVARIIQAQAAAAGGAPPPFQ